MMFFFFWKFVCLTARALTSGFSPSSNAAVFSCRFGIKSSSSLSTRFVFVGWTIGAERVLVGSGIGGWSVISIGFRIPNKGSS